MVSVFIYILYKYIYFENVISRSYNLCSETYMNKESWWSTIYKSYFCFIAENFIFFQECLYKKNYNTVKLLKFFKFFLHLSKKLFFFKRLIESKNDHDHPTPLMTQWYRQITNRSLYWTFWRHWRGRYLRR